MTSLMVPAVIQDNRCWTRWSQINPKTTRLSWTKLDVQAQVRTSFPSVNVSPQTGVIWLSLTKIPPEWFSHLIQPWSFCWADRIRMFNHEPSMVSLNILLNYSDNLQHRDSQNRWRAETRERVRQDDGPHCLTQCLCRVCVTCSNYPWICKVLSKDSS